MMVGVRPAGAAKAASVRRLPATRSQPAQAWITAARAIAIPNIT
jgi:hypothetical protein